MSVIVITGTSRGIGLEMVKILAEQGHKIYALSRNSKPTQDLNHKNVFSYVYDMTDSDAAKVFARELQAREDQIDALVHNAGRFDQSSLADCDLDRFKAVYEVNVFGVVALTQALLPFMHSKTHVLSMSSMGGIQGSMKFAGLSAYSSSKAALVGLTELWAEEFKENGPRFNALALGAVQTEMLDEAFPDYKAPLTAYEMAVYAVDFALNGHRYYNGKCLQVSSSTP
ncbi:MAG: short-chain dehydrogenase [Flavobacteriaceae bacterium]|nr:short-chain dehydrogenase [Flavobacteriaceae bacterium]